MLSHLRNTIQEKKKTKAKGKPFNPNFDGNLLAWYDGDTLATDPANTWSDKSSNGLDLTLRNNPTLINNAINGHDALQFDGINQDARNVTGFTFNQPHSEYVVFKPIVYNAGSRIWSMPQGGFTTYYQQFASPQSWLYAGFNVGNLDVPINNYEIVTTVVNGANSKIRLNNNAAITGNAGGGNGVNIYLASDNAVYNNCEIAYLIIRTGADDAAIQNIIITALKIRFSL